MKHQPAKKFILIVEDDPNYSEIYKEKIIKEGFDVVVAPNGESGLKTAKKRRPDLILLDIVMPKMDGFEFLKKIQQYDNLKDVKILVMTNLSQDSDVSLALKSGASDYFVKSDMSIGEMMEKIKANV